MDFIKGRLKVMQNELSIKIENAIKSVLNKKGYEFSYQVIIDHCSIDNQTDGTTIYYFDNKPFLIIDPPEIIYGENSVKITQNIREV